MVDEARWSWCSDNTVHKIGNRPWILHGYKVPDVFEQDAFDVLESLGEKADERLSVGVGMLTDNQHDGDLDRADEIPCVMVRSFGVVVSFDLRRALQLESCIGLYEPTVKVRVE